MAELPPIDELETRAGEEGTGERRLAGVYAEALLDAAEKRERAEETGRELADLAVAVWADERVAQLLASPIIKRRSKELLLAKAFEGKASDLLFDFLRVVNNKDRLGLLGPIAVAYRELLDKRAKRVPILVRAAVALDDAQQNSLRDTLRAALGKEPILHIKVDSNLLGGMVVQIGDEVFDATVRSRIETLRNQLLASSSHEIQVRRDRFSIAG
jgi:F-type H+-transporting ATPase subunit delta